MAIAIVWTWPTHPGIIPSVGDEAVRELGGPGARTTVDLTRVLRALALAVAATMVAACSGPHNGGAAKPGRAAAPPIVTPSAVKPSQTAAVPSGDGTDLTFTGAIVGTMENPTAACGGSGGTMSVTGTVEGQTRIITIWRSGPGPGQGGPVDEGVRPSDIQYRGAPTGVTAFNSTEGASLDLDMPPFNRPGPAIHLRGHIVCPGYLPEPTLAGATRIAFSGAISGTMQNPRVVCDLLSEGRIIAWGIVDGTVRTVTLWSNGPAPGRLASVDAGTFVDAVQFSRQAEIPGITGFDRDRGATFDIQLPPAPPTPPSWTPRAGPGLHLRGQVVCPPSALPPPRPRLTGPTRLVFSGAIAGAMLNPAVVCQHNIGGGDGGHMAVSGTVAGARHVLTVWSSGTTPGRPYELYEGVEVGAIDYVDTPDLAGVTAFDWARGATVQVDLIPSASSTAGGPSLHLSGQIVCP